MRRLLTGLALLALIACGGDSTAPPPNITGTWAGASSTGVVLNLVLTQSAGQITGTGQISGGGTTVALTATGTFANPAVSLDLEATGFSGSNYTGTLTSPTAITGALNGSGFVNERIILTKQ